MTTPSTGDLIVVISAALAAVPVALCYAARWWLDRGSLVPPWIFPLMLVAGGAGGLLFAWFGYDEVRRLFEGVWGARVAPGSLLSTAVLVPATEELGKAFVLLPLALTPWFRGPVDGLIYGFAAGAGFACVESFMFFASAYEFAGEAGWLGAVITRAVPAALVHGGAASAVGAFLGAARFDGRPGVVIAAPLCGFVVALLVHGIWNWLVTAASMTGDYRFNQVAVLTLPVLLGLGLLALRAAVMLEARAVAPLLALEVAAGTLRPVELEAALNRAARRRDDWLPPGADRARLLGAVMGLGLALYRWRLEGRGAARVRSRRAAVLQARRGQPVNETSLTS